MGSHSHKKPEQKPQTQRQLQAAARLQAQKDRGSKKFDGKDQHLGASRSQSGQPRR